MRKWFIHAAIVALVAVTLTACNSQADVASDNLSKAAEEFEIERRIVFLNGITDSYPLVIEGKCSIETAGALSVTCRTGDNAYKKHYLWLSDNMSFFVEQMDAVPVDSYHYRVFFRPEQILPDIDR